MEDVKLTFFNLRMILFWLEKALGSMWAIMSVPKAFELVSGLGINYHKSKLIGINTSTDFLDVVAYVLSCKVEACNFTFLGIPIGANLRKHLTWVPLLNKMKKRLSGWKNHFLNLGGRITLLKSILCAISIFTMSFYKMPSRVVKELTSIQGKFLWGFGGKDKDSLDELKEGVYSS
ncbi:uncharacterized protein LOC131632555 [Vicia villosa]|uniref:uncharacterized protein LOC131632555 n=1 Tax=Vicia villosa TaxID=3911 RepID=UPI00273B3CDF|nr:uncharacterized protein LOC131632555 [Vicia villosa]